jgi:hypothetical protein
MEWWKKERYWFWSCSGYWAAERRLVRRGEAFQYQKDWSKVAKQGPFEDERNGVEFNMGLVGFRDWDKISLRVNRGAFLIREAAGARERESWESSSGGVMILRASEYKIFSWPVDSIESEPSFPKYGDWSTTFVSGGGEGRPEDIVG